MTDNSFLFSQLAVPISFSCLDLTSDSFEYSTKVLSIFDEGFVITSPKRLRKGSVLSLRLRVPSDEIDGKYFENRCTARVVAEQQFKDGGVGYKVQLDSSLPN
jgi:hypothetical protein